MEDLQKEKFYDVLPIRNNVVFPGVMMPIAVSKENNLRLIRAAQKDERPILVLTQIGFTVFSSCIHS